MAFLDHIDPGNAGGSVPIPEPIRHYKEAKGPVTHLCPYCDLLFSNINEMDKHRVDAHPVRRPVMVFEGRVHRRQELVITEPMTDHDLAFHDVDSISIDSRTYDLVEAEEYLKEQRTGFFDVRIRHQSYEVIHQLHFRIVDSNVLRQIDECFYDAFSTKLSLTDQLSVFHRKVEELPEAGRFYSGGLGAYITGLIIKDGLHHSLPSSVGFLDKLGEAEDKLASYRRALPQSIIAIVHFIRSDFRPHPGDRYLPALERARSIFRSGILKPASSESMKGNAEVPIDSATESLVEWSLLLPQDGEFSLRPILNLYQAKSVSQDDRHKAGFLLWLNDRHFGIHSTKSDIEKILRYSPSFKNILTELESSE
jgi:hypothetical protein